MTFQTTSLRDVRSPMTGGVAYLYDCGEIGRATWRDVSADGASIQMGRYLRPSRTVVLRFPSPALPEISVFALPIPTMDTPSGTSTGNPVLALKVPAPIFTVSPETARLPPTAYFRVAQGSPLV